jgi:hypothetical protein
VHDGLRCKGATEACSHQLCITFSRGTTRDDLIKLTEPELIQRVVDLQQVRDDAAYRKDNKSAHSREKVIELVKQAREMTRKGIQKHMKVCQIELQVNTILSKRQGSSPSNVKCRARTSTR